MKLQLILLDDLFYRGTGPAGTNGETPTLTIGTVNTGAPGSQGSATSTGDAQNYTLNLANPQGHTGPQA